MNIYMLIEDGEPLVYQAETMVAAIDAGEQYYLNEEDITPETHTPEEIAEERNLYRNGILTSCQLVGELKNPTLLEAF